MKVICGKDELIRGTQMVQSVIPSRSTLPVLSNFLFETDGQQIKLSATDLEIGIICHIKGEVVQEGSITIPAKRFGDIIRELPEGSDIEIKSDNMNQINIKSGKSNVILMGLPKTDYPVLPIFPEDNSFSLSKDLLRLMIKRVSFAASTDEMRYVLNSVYIDTEEDIIKFVATDGRRLSFISRKVNSKIAKNGAVVPIKTVNEIQKVLSSDQKEEEVKIGITENQIAFKTSSVTVISRLVDGSFPKYEQIIPKRYERQIKLRVKETLSAVRQMSMLTLDRISSDKISPVRLMFGNNILRVSASTQGLGSGEVELDVEHSGSVIEVAFNPQFIIDVLKNIDDPEVYMEITNSTNPILIHPVNDKDTICVIVPVKPGS